MTKGYRKKSAKALLATDQMIPGLGNGVLQDILYLARVHPKTKIAVLSPGEKGRAFRVCEEGFAGDIPTGRTLFREGFV